MPSERAQRRIESLLDQADAAIDRSDWRAVQEISAAILTFDAENEEALALRQAAENAISAGRDDVLPATPATEHTSTQSSKPAEMPSHFGNGRYEIIGLLGEGGKKKVYAVHDTTLDRDVAFGLIKAEGLDDASRQRITREAQAMARLGDNPNIMPIFDLGEENGQPYMVGPLMGGGDVEALIEGAEDGRLSLEDALRIASEICRGLEFAHSKSIIHRDLKPGNVWLTDDGTARIGDFGLALSLDRSRLTQEKMMVGTVSYMPPEQATGGEVTPRSDLYSLGAMLYEMVTGRPPFLGDDEIAIIGQHINTPPVAPSWHNQSLPQTLDSLIMRMLAKDPAERPESAAEVLQALEAIDPAEVAAVHDEEEGSLDSMSGGVFVGRHREMDQLKATFEDTLGGHGKMVALVGEPGIGKTRTAQELATYANMRGGQVLWGRCYEGGGAPPYWPWVQAIRSYVTARDSETVRREMGSTASVIAEIVADVKERLPDLQPPQQIDDPDSARFRLFDAITTFLKTASSTQPIVLMLEDLHWSDKQSLMLLEFVARELGNSRVMIVANYRDMELNRRHPLSMTLGELTREHLFERVLLRGLQKHDVQRFIEVAAGIDPPNALVDVVHKQTEGNPLFVTETVRLLIQEGDIGSGGQVKGGTSSWEIRVPEGVREVIGRRFDRLSERCNEVLAIAAVIGRQFRFNVLMKLADDVSENMMLDVLDEALDARIVEEVSSEVGLYQFTHALMQETLTSELSAARRVRVHARIGEALESSYGADVDQHAAELAGHFTEAEPVLGGDKAVHYSVMAGEQALSANGFDDAEAYFRQAQTLRQGQPEDEITARILHGLGRILTTRVDQEIRQEGLDLLSAAFDIYVKYDNVAAAAQAAGTEVMIAGLSRVSDLTARALNILDPDSLEAGYLAVRHGNALLSDGDYEGELRALELGMKIAKQYGDGRLEGRVNLHYAQHHSAKGDREKVIEYCLKADELATEAGDLLYEHRAMIWGAWAYLARWEYSNARRLVNRATEIAENLRHPLFLTIANQMAWFHAYWMGDWAGANGLAKSEVERTKNESSFQYRNIAIQSQTGPGLSTLERPFDTPVVSVSESSIALAITMWIAARDPQDLERWEEAIVSTKTVTLADDRWVKDMAVGALALASRQRDRLPGAYDEISRYAGLWERTSGTAVDHLLGMLASRMQRYDQAVEHFEFAMGRSREWEFKPTLALVSSDYAELLLNRDAPGDREKATELQEEAITIATELGMKPLLERVLAQREMLKA